MTIDEVKTFCVEESETAVLVFSLEYWNPRLHKRRVGCSRQKKGTKTHFHDLRKWLIRIYLRLFQELEQFLLGSPRPLIRFPASCISCPHVLYLASPRSILHVPASLILHPWAPTSLYTRPNAPVSPCSSPILIPSLQAQPWGPPGFKALYLQQIQQLGILKKNSLSIYKNI